MSLVSSRVGMRHRCTIERKTSPGPDGWGGPKAGEWAEHLTGLPCNAWSEAAREPVDDDRTAAFEDRRLSVPLGTDVTEEDRVLVVTDRRGRTVMGGPMGIEGILTTGDHLELIVQVIR